MRILYLVRGHGFGHAARDLRIIEALKALAPQVEIEIASSGTGMQYFRSRSVDCADLEIPDDEDQSASAGWRVWRYLHWAAAPDLVISDEIMFAIPYCRNVLDVPCVLLTDWVYRDIGKPQLDRLLDGAAEVVVVDFPESHPTAIGTSAPITHIGPVVDRFPLNPADGERGNGKSKRGLTAVASFGGMTDRPNSIACWTGPCTHGILMPGPKTAYSSWRLSLRLLIRGLALSGWD